MFKRILTVLILWLERLTYEPMRVDNANSKLIVPVHGLIINGKQLYRYKNDLDIPVRRKVAISGVHKWFGATIQIKEVIQFLVQIREANNAGDKSRVGLLAFSLEDMLTNCTDAEAFYMMAACLYFYKEEDHSQFDNDIAKEKIAAFKKLTQKDQAFFLTTLLKHMGVSKDTSINHILTNLNRSKVKLSGFRQLLSDAGSGKD